jgi:hypothetical protein
VWKTLACAGTKQHDLWPVAEKTRDGVLVDLIERCYAPCQHRAIGEQHQRSFAALPVDLDEAGAVAGDEIELGREV